MLLFVFFSTAFMPWRAATHPGEPDQCAGRERQRRQEVEEYRLRRKKIVRAATAAVEFFVLFIAAALFLSITSLSWPSAALGLSFLFPGSVPAERERRGDGSQYYGRRSFPFFSFKISHECARLVGFTGFTRIRTDKHGGVCWNRIVQGLLKIRAAQQVRRDQPLCDGAMTRRYSERAVERKYFLKLKRGNKKGWYLYTEVLMSGGG